MDRRILAIALLAAACSSREAPAGFDAATFLVPPPEQLDASPDALVEPDAEPIGADDVLSGAAAEQAIAAGKTTDQVPGQPTGETPAPPPAEDQPAFLITAEGVGPYRINMPRADVIKAIRGRAFLVRVPTPPGEPSIEVSTVPGPLGGPLLRLRVYAGRLVEVQVLARDRRAVTESGILVGSSFQEAMDALGEPRMVTDGKTGRKLGWVLSDLAGVLFVPLDPRAMNGETPPGLARVARIVVVGPEATAPDD